MYEYFRPDLVDTVFANGLGAVAIEKGSFGTPTTRVANFTLLMRTYHSFHSR